MTVTPAASEVTVAQDGSPAMLNVTVARPSGDSSSVSMTVLGLPGDVSATVTNPDAGASGSITFTASPGIAGTFPITISATDGVASGNASINLVTEILATVGTQSAGQFSEFMATSFQPAEWDDTFFANNPSAVTTLAGLQSQHIRLQPVSAGTPQKADQTWDFSTLDAILDQVATVDDKSPELQLAQAPAWMDDSNGHIEPTHYQDFANYCADMVKYYNTTTGFVDSSGVLHVHNPYTPITWWGIFNEPNINGLTAAQYVQLYNLVVPAMQAAGSQVPIKFVAIELADFGTEPEKYLPTFVASSTGVNAQVDAVATHFYSTCNQADTDQTLFNTIPNFVSDVKYIESELATNPALANVPVWVTENNVNADYDKGGGISACNGTPFTLDLRGTNAFFAAWRPYVFSQLGQAGNRALYHWDFDADGQYGEVNYNTDATYLSYWVDYWLEREFPSPPGATLLTLTSTEASPATVDVLAVQNSDGSVVVLISNHAVATPTDDNGPGAPRTVILDLSQLGSFSSASLLTFDANTNPATGPSPSPVTPASQMTITLNGYGSAILTLTK